MVPSREPAETADRGRSGLALARRCVAITLGVLVGAPALPHDRPLGSDAAACEAGKPAVLVVVSGFKSEAGRVRVQLYGSVSSDFLRTGAKLRRIDLPVTGDPMTICVQVPSPGSYAIAVRHDRNGNGKSDFRDGAGFSRNPPIKGLRQPRHEQVAFAVGSTTVTVPITLLYLHGLKAAPAAHRD